MTTTTNEATRRTIPATPKMRLREVGDAEGWNKRALILTKNLEPLVGPLPPVACAVACSRRRPCGTCHAWDAWDDRVVELIHRATGWDLCSYGLNSAHMTGRPYAHGPSVSLVRGGKAVKVSWSGGWDI